MSGEKKISWTLLLITESQMLNIALNLFFSLFTPLLNIFHQFIMSNVLNPFFK